jgi:hypothetical protein
LVATGRPSDFSRYFAGVSRQLANYESFQSGQTIRPQRAVSSGP